MTNQTTWQVYDGSDEQIAEIRNAGNGYVARLTSGKEILIKPGETYHISNPSVEKVTHYWLIPDDPLREMKIRQAQTGQPVWVRVPTSFIRYGYHYITYGATTTPDWNIPNANYSFSPFQE